MQAGDLLGPYRLIEILGAGGMGVVWKAQDRRLHRTVAIKLISPEAVDQAGNRARLLQEARAAAALQHPSVCTLYEIDESHPYLVMEFVGGPTLKAHIAGRPLPFQEALRIALSVAAGLQAAHNKGITHRDIKPANILLDGQGEAKITDFGLARLTANCLLTRHGDIVGTPAYMAPEQMNGDGADRRSDVWSFGMVLHEMLTGRLPGPASLEPLPAGIDRIVRKCLSPAPAQRYQHMDDLLVDLRAVTVMQGGRRRLYWLASAAAIAVLAAVIAFQVGQDRQSERSAPTNPASQEAYLRGKFLASRPEKEGQKKGLALLERAVELEPGFAAGHAALARAYVAYYFGPDPASRSELEPKAYAAVEKALELDPNLPDAYIARGLLVWTPSNGFPHARAIRDLRRAAKDSRSSEALRLLARIYFHVGLPKRGLDELRSATKLDPNLAEARYSDLGHRTEIALCLASIGRHDQALEEWSRFSPKTMLPFNAANMAYSLHVLGKGLEARALMDEIAARVGPQEENVAAMRALLLAADGNPGQARQQIAVALSKETDSFGHFHHVSFWVASAFARLGEQDNAMRWLKYTAESGFPNVTLFEMAPDLEPLRLDARYQTLLTRWKAHADEINAIE